MKYSLEASWSINWSSYHTSGSRPINIVEVWLPGYWQTIVFHIIRTYQKYMLVVWSFSKSVVQSSPQSSKTWSFNRTVYEEGEKSENLAWIGHRSFKWAAYMPYVKHSYVSRYELLNRRKNVWNGVWGHHWQMKYSPHQIEKLGTDNFHF